MARKKEKNKRQYNFSKVRISIFLIFTILLATFAFVFKTPIENLVNNNSTTSVIDYNGLVVHTIDVGQAEAIMIKLPDGKNMMVDSGNTGSEKNEKLKSYLLNNYFQNVENQEIDYFVLTHSDTDHIGGAVMIFDTFQVNKVFRPNIYAAKSSEDLARMSENELSDSGTEWGNVVEKMYEEPNCEITFSKAGIEIVESLYSIKFYAPNQTKYGTTTKIDKNSYSPIIVIEYSSRIFMLTGDATETTENESLENLPEVDILNVAHHGSKSSSTSEFLAKIKPKYAIISSNKNDGAGKTYGHPNTETLNRLKMYMSENKIFRTDTNGNIVTTISQSGEISFILDVQSNSFYIKVEYILLCGVAVLFVLCFKIQTNGKKSSK